ncbi:winged helix-turn-helix transcriptional regulator [Streptomyces sp. BBFR2]|uniref:winged helix-turn-helix transcriptional regulator n=1 Tax=Streptomyces sp. BBFR2 TaxID=3372854 RepID=UPI0037D9C10E
MYTPSQSSPASISTVDAQRVEDALSLIAPKWTNWSVQTLAEQGRPMRVRDVAVRLPFIREQLVGKRLAQMHADGLVTRVDGRHGAPYQLSAFGGSLSQVHAALSDWSQSNLSLGDTAGAERVEDAVRRLHLRHSTAVIQALDAGAARLSHVAEATGLDLVTTQQRLNRLQVDGLATRAGPRYGAPYSLTDAGRALGPVYTAVEHWSSPVTAQKYSAPAPVAAVARTHPSVPQRPDGPRTAAALRRSAAPSALFSHAPQPQPRVPAAITALSKPARGR